MLITVHPKLPMRDPIVTGTYYSEALGFAVVGAYDNYLILRREGIELHFFLSKDLDPLTNDGQVYIRATEIDHLYRTLQERGVTVHPNGGLSTKPWGQREFALLDPDHNLLTFGEAL